MTNLEWIWVGLSVALGGIFFWSDSFEVKYRFLILYFLGPAAGWLCVVTLVMDAIYLAFQRNWLGVILCALLSLFISAFASGAWDKAVRNYGYIQNERKRRIQEFAQNMLFYWPKGVLVWAHQQWRSYARRLKALKEKKA